MPNFVTVKLCSKGYQFLLLISCSEGYNNCFKVVLSFVSNKATMILFWIVIERWLLDFVGLNSTLSFMNFNCKKWTLVSLFSSSFWYFFFLKQLKYLPSCTGTFNRAFVSAIDTSWAGKERVATTTCLSTQEADSTNVTATFQLKAITCCNFTRTLELLNYHFKLTRLKARMWSK